MNLVEFKNVSRSYQIGEVSVTALKDVTLNIPKDDQYQKAITAYEKSLSIEPGNTNDIRF